jgi:hypothetical protein
MSFTYDLATETGQIRLLIPDRVDTADEPAIFSDEELAAFLQLEDGVRRAAAAALETIASDQALVLKVMRVQNVSTDGAALARELRARASGLRTQAAAAAADDGDLFDVAEQVNDQFSARERLWKEALRRGA